MSKQSDRLARNVFGRRDGNYAFLESILPRLLPPGGVVLDVGGGKRPSIPAEVKAKLGLRVTGLDISGEELGRAPAGSYDETIVGDVAQAPLGEARFDLIFSSALMEHVVDVPGAIANLARAVRPGGRMAHFVPCGSAPFARLNRVLGNEQAKRLLHGIMPNTKATQGFPAYYHQCTPSEFEPLVQGQAFEVEELIPYYSSGYASFLFPLHLAEIAAQLTAMKILRNADYCESFVLIARKRAAPAAGH
ncbi:MAG: class I SAM-dependent methyltransferase [Myxococcota bacterium]